MENGKLMNIVIKSLTIWVIIYVVLKFLIKVNMPDSDIGVISVIVTLTAIGIDNFGNIFKNASSTMCSNVCSKNVNEKFGSALDPIHTGGKGLGSFMGIGTNSNPPAPTPTSLTPTTNSSPTSMPSSNVDPLISDSSSDGFLSYLIKPYDDVTNRNGSRAQQGVMKNEMQYNMKYSDFNTLPMPAESDNEYEFGYSFLPPSKWFPVPPHPPVCVTEKQCPVCPMTTVGTPVDAKEWDDSRRVTPPDSISVDYIKDKLNSGR